MQGYLFCIKSREVHEINRRQYILSFRFFVQTYVKVRARYRVIGKVKPLSYIRARESLVKLLREFVPNAANISLHSFRSGGATTAANAQVLDRCWKRHGRWRSETAKDGYVEDSLDNRLLVTKSLGI